MSDLDNDLNSGWRDSIDYRPNKMDECRICEHPFHLHQGENYDGSDDACLYEDDDGRCGCICFET